MSDLKFFGAAAPVDQYDDTRSVVSIQSLSKHVFTGGGPATLKPVPIIHEEQQTLTLDDLEYDEEAAQGLEELRELRGEEEQERENDGKAERDVLEKLHKEHVYLLGKASEKIWLEGDDAIYVPQHVNNVAVHNNWVETTGTLQESAMPDWHPVDTFGAVMAFGSQDKYAQGLEAPMNGEPTGNMQNAFVCGLTCRNLQNDSPVPVGVTVGQTSEAGDFRPFGDLRVTHEGTRYHAILPPGKTASLPLYRNTARINHFLGRRYFWLHEKLADKGLQGYINNSWLVKKTHPVVDIIYMLKAKFDWPEPRVQPNPSGKGESDYLIIPNDVKRKAIEILQQILRHSLPVVDLRRFRIRFTPLHNGKATHLRTNQLLAQQETDRLKTLAAKKQLNLQVSQEVLQSRNSLDFGVSFQMQSILVFRDHYSDERILDVEDGEEEEEKPDSASVFSNMMFTQA